MTMMTDAKNTFVALIPKLRQAIQKSRKMEDEVNYSALSPDERMEFDQLKKAGELFADVIAQIDCLTQPVIAEGILYKNDLGRYEIDKTHEFTSGSPIEVLINDDFCDCKKWVKTRVEHKGEDYYLVGYGKIPMQGLRVRVRSRGMIV